jgi:hypothetical protein
MCSPSPRATPHAGNAVGHPSRLDGPVDHSPKCDPLPYGDQHRREEERAWRIRWNWLGIQWDVRIDPMSTSALTEWGAPRQLTHDSARQPQYDPRGILASRSAPASVGR